MTLVVARVDGWMAALFADTRLTYSDARKPDHLAPYLKIVILNPSLAVGFAGNPHFAEADLFPLVRTPYIKADDVIERLLASNIESERAIDYIVVALSPRSKPQLTRIRNGWVERNLPHAWIGDEDGWKVYREAEERSRPERSRLDRIQGALQAVIESDRVPSVGGFPLGIRSQYSDPPGIPYFLFACYATADSGLKGQTIPSGVATPLVLGGAPHGSYRVSVLSSISIASPGVAIYIPELQKGMLLCPHVCCKLIRFDDLSGSEFADLVSRRYQVHLVGFLPRDDGFEFVDTSARGRSA